MHVISSIFIRFQPWHRKFSVRIRIWIKKHHEIWIKRIFHVHEEIIRKLFFWILIKRWKWPRDDVIFHKLFRRKQRPFLVKIKTFNFIHINQQTFKFLSLPTTIQPEFPSWKTGFLSEEPYWKSWNTRLQKSNSQWYQTSKLFSEISKWSNWFDTNRNCFDWFWNGRIRFQRWNTGFC